MFLYVLMTISNTLEWSLFVKSMTRSLFLKLFVILSKYKREKRLTRSFSFKTNMEENFKILNSLLSALLKGSSLSSLPHDTSTEPYIAKNG